MADRAKAMGEVTGAEAFEAAATASEYPRSRGKRNRLIRGLLTHPPTLVALVFLSIVLIGALLGPLVIPFGVNTVRLTDALRAPRLGHGLSGHIFGTDDVGRDVLVRVFAGGRISLLIGFVGASGSAAIGCLIGLLAGWYRGPLGAVLMRIADLQLAFPFLLFAITVTAVLGSGLSVLLIIFSVWSWGGYARVAEGMTLSVSKREFVEAVRTMGAGTPRILFRHVLPQLTSVVLVLWSFSFAILIISEASLSFLGMGIQPPTPSWGTMLAEGEQYIRTAWWLVLFPGLAISLTVWSLNTVGDRLRDTVDRRLSL